MTQRTERGFFLLIPSFRSSEWTEMNFLWDCWFLNIKYSCWETFCSFLLWQLASEHPCSCCGKSFILILHWVAVACDISYPAGSITQDCTLLKPCQPRGTSGILSIPVAAADLRDGFLLYHFGEPKSSYSLVAWWMILSKIPLIIAKVKLNWVYSLLNVFKDRRLKQGAEDIFIL